MLTGKGDRKDPADWTVVKGPVDVVLFEGWMFGFRELPAHDAFKANKDLAEVNARLRHYVNAWDTFMDSWLVLKVSPCTPPPLFSSPTSFSASSVSPFYRGWLSCSPGQRGPGKCLCLPAAQCACLGYLHGPVLGALATRPPFFPFVCHVMRILLRIPMLVRDL